MLIYLRIKMDKLSMKYQLYLKLENSIQSKKINATVAISPATERKRIKK